MSGWAFSGENWQMKAYAEGNTVGTDGERFKRNT
ncbi:hypothetical protein X734_31590 [Mesorhizobium sp. L2C084A000]|nr:hypothetical protein X734_31590 [Mesorhizobium sp. L2C084A000]